MRSRTIALFLVAAMVIGNLNLASLATGPSDNGSVSRTVPRGMLFVNQTTVADFRAGIGTNLSIFNVSDGELRLRGFEIFDPGVPGISPIRDLEVDSRGTLYIGTQPGTVLTFDPVNYSVIDHGRAVPDEDNINRLWVDSNDTLWGGGRSNNGVTLNRGGILWRMNTTIMRFDSVGKVEMVNQQIRGLTTDKNGTVWVGDMNGVLARFDPTTGSVFRLNNGNPLLAGGGIYRIAAAPNGMIYAGTTNVWPGGVIFKIDPTTNTFQTINGGNPISNNEGIQALECAENGTIYGGTSNNNGILFMINTSNDQVVNLGRPIPTGSSIGDIYPAPDGSVYGSAGGGTLADFHLFKVENGTGAIRDIGTPYPGTAWPGMIAVAPDGTVYGTCGNQYIFRYSEEYSNSTATRLNRLSSGRIFTENFEMSSIVWDPTPSNPNSFNFVRVQDGSRPSGDQIVYQETALSATAYARVGSQGPNPPNTDAFQANPAGVLETSFKLNAAGATMPYGVRLFMDWCTNGQNYMLIFNDDNDQIILMRDNLLVGTPYTGMKLDPGFWYDVKWKVFHTGILPGAAFCVWINGTKIFDEVPLGPPHRLAGSVMVGTRYYNASFDDIRFYKDTNITVNGIQAGQNVTLYSSNGTRISTNRSTGASVVINVSQTSFPIAGYFNITDSGGVNLSYTSPVYPDMYGGDVYTMAYAPLGTWRYVQSGSFLSGPIDAGDTVSWKNLSWNAKMPGNTNLSFRTRTAPSAAALDASAWSQPTNITPSPILSPADRWLQYEVNFTSTLVTATPELRDVLISYEVFPNFTLEMNQSTGLLYPGDMITYNIFYNQTGNGPSRTIVIRDALPPELVFMDSSNEGARNGSVWTLSDIGPRTDSILTILAIVRADVPDNTTISNTASINYTDLDGTPFGTLSTQTLTARIIRPNVTLEMTGPEFCSPGDNVNITVFLNNSGLGTTGDFWLNVTFDPALTFLTSSEEAIRNGLSWQLSGLTGNNALNITAGVNSTLRDKMVTGTSAQLNYTLPNGIEPAGLTAPRLNMTVRAPVVYLDKSVDASTALPGDTLKYTIRFNNSGSAPTGDFVVQDPLDQQLEFVNSSTPRNQTDGFWHFGSLMPDASGLLSITARVKDDTKESTAIRNTAFDNLTTSSGISLGGLSTNTVTTTIGKLTYPNITLQMSADRSEAAWNDTVNLTLFYNNTGDGAGLGALITLELPSGMSLVNSTSESNRAGNLWNFSTVPGGEHSFMALVKVGYGIANNTVLTAKATLNYTDARGKEMPTSGSEISVRVTTEPVVQPPQPGTRPTITDRAPSPNAIEVSIDTTIQVRFSAPMNPSTLAMGTTVFISPSVEVSVSWSGNVMTITPLKKLSPGTRYTVTITTDAKDTGGNQLDKTYTWDFTTKAKGSTVKPEGYNWVPLAITLAVIIGVCAVIGIAFRRKKDKAPPVEAEQPTGASSPENMFTSPKEPDETEPKPEHSKEEPKPEPKAEPKPELPKEEPKPEPKAEPKPEPPKEEPKPEPKAEPKPEPPKEEPKPEPKAEPKPEPPKEQPKSDTAKETAKIDNDLEALLKKLTQ